MPARVEPTLAALVELGNVGIGLPEEDFNVQEGDAVRRAVKLFDVTVVEALFRRVGERAGRAYRRLGGPIIRDRRTGKTAVAIDAIINPRGRDVKGCYVATGQKQSTVAQVDSSSVPGWPTFWPSNSVRGSVGVTSPNREPKERP